MTTVAELIKAGQLQKQAAEEASETAAAKARQKAFEIASQNLVRRMKTVLDVDVPVAEITRHRYHYKTDACVTIDGLTFSSPARPWYVNEEDKRVHVRICCANGHDAPDYVAGAEASVTIHNTTDLLRTYELVQRTTANCQECLKSGLRQTALQLVIAQSDYASRIELLGAVVVLAEQADEPTLTKALETMRIARRNT